MKQQYEMSKEKITDIVKTLVPLMEWSHIEHMMGRIQTKTHQDIYLSWHKITKKFYELEAVLR